MNVNLLIFYLLNESDIVVHILSLAHQAHSDCRAQVEQVNDDSQFGTTGHSASWKNQDGHGVPLEGPSMVPSKQVRVEWQYPQPMMYEHLCMY